jgi:integrase
MDEDFMDLIDAAFLSAQIDGPTMDLTDLAVLTGLRRGDLLALTRSQLKDDGIHVQTSKTGKKLIIEWNDELRDVVSRAKRLKPQVRKNVIATRGGKQFTGNGFQSTWQRAMKKATMEEKLEQRFTFNDLRSKSASDSSDLLEASERLGHSSVDLTRRVYRRKPARVRALMRSTDRESGGQSD